MDWEALKFEDVSRRAIDHLKVQIDKVNWFSTYYVHHRVASQFRKGRAFLLGDAAHIHSPAGGRGMNAGLGDAINLAWKLAAVLGGRGPDALLDSYDAGVHSLASGRDYGYARRRRAERRVPSEIATPHGGARRLVENQFTLSILNL